MTTNDSFRVAFIFARGGSKGVPRKNIRMLAGKPLIAHSIEVAQASPSIDRVVTSTDDEEIAAISRQYGAEVPFMRPKELASDNSYEWLSWRHAIITYQEIVGKQIDVMISLPPTSPLRAVDDVEACSERFDEGEADVVISVMPSHRNPYLNMVTLDEKQLASVVIQSETLIVGRQDAPSVFDMTTVVYAARPQFVLEADKLFAGRVKAVVIPAERSLDIDTPFDFKIAELLMEERRLANREVA